MLTTFCPLVSNTDKDASSVLILVLFLPCSPCPCTPCPLSATLWQSSSLLWSIALSVLQFWELRPSLTEPLGAGSSLHDMATKIQWTGIMVRLLAITLVGGTIWLMMADGVEGCDGYLGTVNWRSCCLLETCLCFFVYKRSGLSAHSAKSFSLMFSSTHN